MVCKKCGAGIVTDADPAKASQISCTRCGTVAKAYDHGKRPVWFTVVLCLLIACNIAFIIYYADILITRERDIGMQSLPFSVYVIQVVLHSIQIAFIMLLLFKMKRSLLIAFVVFLAVSSVISVFVGFLFTLFMNVLAYFVFQSQWDKFKKKR